MNDFKVTLAELQKDLEASPFQRLFDLEAMSINPGPQVTIRLGYTGAVERQAGSGQYHGGALASLIDIAGDYALMASLGGAVPTINFRTDFLRPAGGTHVFATATVRRAGRTVGVVDVDVIDDQGRLVAVGRGCYSTQVG